MLANSHDSVLDSDSEQTAGRAKPGARVATRGSRATRVSSRAGDGATQKHSPRVPLHSPVRARSCHRVHLKRYLTRHRLEVGRRTKPARRQVCDRDGPKRVVTEGTTQNDYSARDLELCGREDGALREPRWPHGVLALSELGMLALFQKARQLIPQQGVVLQHHRQLVAVAVGVDIVTGRRVVFLGECLRRAPVPEVVLAN